MPEPEAVTPEPQQAEPTPTAAAKTGGKTYTEDEVQNLIKDRLEREKSRREKEAQEAAKKAADEAAKANAEWEKLAKQREEENAKLTAELKARDLADRKRSIAVKVGLPESLAPRLVGETDEDIEKDAKALAATLPKAPKTSTLGPTNPGGAKTGETDLQRLQRIHGAPANAWDIASFRERGGGVITSKE